MARVAEGIEQRGGSLRLSIRWQGQRITETHPGELDAKHIRRVVKRREWLLARLRLGLPIYEDDAKSLGHIADEYFDCHQGKRSSKRSDENLWKNYWSHWQGELPQSITTAMIKVRLAEKGVAVKTQKNALSVLSSILNHAEVNPNPCRAVKFKKQQKAKKRRYTHKEVSALLSKLEGEYRVYFVLMAAIGLRPGEALALEWTDWNGERLSITKAVSRRRMTTTKNEETREVYLPQWARKTLNGHTTRFEGGYIFQNALGSFHRDSDDFNAAWKKAHKKARIPYRIPYTLRHTRAAELLSLGCLPAKAAKELGHSVPMFLTTYSQFIDEYSKQDTSVLESRHQIDTKGDVSD